MCPRLPAPKPGFGWAPKAALEKAGPVWECSKKDLRYKLWAPDDGLSQVSRTLTKDSFFPSLVPGRGLEAPPGLFCFA